MAKQEGIAAIKEVTEALNDVVGELLELDAETALAVLEFAAGLMRARMAETKTPAPKGKVIDTPVKALATVPPPNQEKLDTPKRAQMKETLDFIKTRSKVTKADLAEKFGISVSGAYQRLQRLEVAGLVTHNGADWAAA